jgi:Fe-S-cluster containining protein
MQAVGLSMRILLAIETQWDNRTSYAMSQSKMQIPLLAARFRAEDALSKGHTAEAASNAALAAHTMFDRAWASEREAVEAQGAIACKAGCNWCCHQHVAVLGAEALAIHNHIAGTDLERRLQASLPALVGSEAETRRAAKIPCPFLEPTGCAIYEVRPNRCRSVYSRDAGYCQRRYDGIRDEAVDPARPIPVEPVEIGDATLSGLGQALHGHGLRADTLEMIHALAILQANPYAADDYAQGGDPFAEARLAPAKPSD